MSRAPFTLAFRLPYPHCRRAIPRRPNEGQSGSVERAGTVLKFVLTSILYRILTYSCSKLPGRNWHAAAAASSPPASISALTNLNKAHDSSRARLVLEIVVARQSSRRRAREHFESSWIQGMSAGKARQPVLRPDNHAMETPRTSLGGLSQAPDEAEGAMPERVASVAKRPEHHRMATPRNSLGSAASSPRRSWRLLRRPDNHAMETPRTSLGSGHRVSLSLRDDRGKCTCRRKTACVVGLMLLVLLAGAVAFVMLTKGKADPGIMPQGACSTVQIQQGCAPGFCTSSRCACSPNYDQMDDSHCAVPLANKRMQFFVYRVGGDVADDAAAGASGGCSADFAQVYSLQGILWYVHNAIVNQSCPRSMNMTRILRCRATVFNTERPFLEWKGQFGPFTSFNSSGSCTSPDCLQTWKRFGHVVGCLPWSGYMGGYSYGNSSHLYSFPDEASKETCLKHWQTSLHWYRLVSLVLIFRNFSTSGLTQHLAQLTLAAHVSAGFW